MARKYAIASVELFDVFEFQPVVTDRGFSAYSTIKSVQERSLYNADLTGTPLLEWIPKLEGIINRAYWVAKDTTLAQWNSTAGDTGSWEEQVPAWGDYIVKRLVQYDGNPNIVGKRISIFNLPINPEFAISFILPDTVEGQDVDTHPAHIRFEFGQFLWCIYIDKSGAYVQFRPTTSDPWSTLERVGTPSPSVGDTSDERLIFVRCVSGVILVSGNFGESYKLATVEGIPVNVPSSKARLTTEGGIIAFGFHQLKQAAGKIILDPKLDTLTSRVPGTMLDSLEPVADIPSPSNLILVDNSDPLHGRVGWAAELIPGVIGSATAVPFQWYKTPTLYAVDTKYAVESSTPTLSSTFPWDDNLIDVNIILPRSLDQTTATFQVQARSAADILAAESYRDRAVRIRLGYEHHDGSEEWYVMFTGYITDVVPVWDDYGKVVVTFVCKNTSYHLERAKWDGFGQYRLGGRALTVAADLVLYTEGLGATSRSWFPLGDYQMLPWGRQDKPFELTRVNEEKWKTLKRLFGYYGYELGVDNYGIFYSLPYNYYLGTVSKTFDARETSTIQNAITRIANRYKYEESATCVVVHGYDQYDQFVLAASVDFEAEQNPFSLRAAAWRTIIIEELFDGVDYPTAVERNIAISRDVFQTKQEPIITTPVDVSVGRRAQVIVDNCERVNIPSGTHMVIASLTHHYTRQQGLSSLESNAGLELIVT